MSTSIDRSGHQLGRRPRVRTIAAHLAMVRFAALVKSLPPPPPGPLGRAQFIAAGLVWLNNVIGDCTAAAKANFLTLWAAANGIALQITDAEVQAFYSGSCGYNPADPSTDQGGNMDAVAAYFKSVGLAGYKADASVVVDPRDRDHVKHAVNRYGGCDMGLALPITAQTQAVWDLDATAGANAEPGSWGGHDAMVFDYNDTGPIFRSWAEDIQATWLWFDAYADEGIAYFNRSLWAPNGTAPCGISADELAAELALVAA